MELKEGFIPKDEFLKAVNSIMTNLFLIGVLKRTEDELKKAVGDRVYRDPLLTSYIAFINEMTNIIYVSNKVLLECKNVILELIEYDDIEEARLLIHEEDWRKIEAFVGSTLVISDTIQRIQKENDTIERYIRLRY